MHRTHRLPPLTGNLSLRIVSTLSYTGHKRNRKILNRHRGGQNTHAETDVEKCTAPLKANDVEGSAIRCSESTYENISLLKAVLFADASTTHREKYQSYSMQKSKSFRGAFI